jgi:hypothetical protein
LEAFPSRDGAVFGALNRVKSSVCGIVDSAAAVTDPLFTNRS